MLHLPKSCTEAMASVKQIVTNLVREEGMDPKGEQR